ncbi:MAG: hypothetical protein VW865_14175 [Halieaceae bacterium]
METTTETININPTYTEQMLATLVVNAREELAAAKAKADEAEDAFRALGIDSVLLHDGTKVAIVEQNRRSIDQQVARDELPEGQHQRLSKRVVQQALVDEAVTAGWLKQAIVNKFTKVTNVKSVKVTKPKR